MKIRRWIMMDRWVWWWVRLNRWMWWWIMMNRWVWWWMRLWRWVWMWLRLRMWVWRLNANWWWMMNWRRVEDRMTAPKVASTTASAMTMSAAVESIQIYLISIIGINRRQIPGVGKEHCIEQ